MYFCVLILYIFFPGPSRSGHSEEGGRSGVRFNSHAATPGESTPSAPQTAARRTHDRMDIVPNNAVVPDPLDDIITTSKYPL